jgi:quercetin dioxygenase-like cupin family protein
MNPKSPQAAAPDDALPDDIGAALSHALAPVPLDPVDRAMMKSRLLAKVKAPIAATGTTTIPLNDTGWEWFGSRVKIKILRNEPDATSYLLKLEPGAVIWPHHHRQDEECMVMDGEVLIGDVRAGAGTYHLAPSGVDHVPIRSETGATLFLRGAMPTIRDLSKRDALRFALTGR